MLAAREVLFEVGKAAAERVAARIDDPGIGQDQADERGVDPVVGQLVDKQRSVGAALDAGALQVFLA